MINSDAEDSDDVTDRDDEDDDEEEAQISGPFTTLTARPPMDIEELARYTLSLQLFYFERLEKKEL